MRVKKFWYEFIPNYARYILVAVAVIFLSFIFPTNAKFRYKFSLNQTWLYDDLIANFDFPIKKTADEIDEEKKTVEKEISPYYNLDIESISFRKKEFIQAFDEQLRRNRSQFPDVARNSETYLSYGIHILDRILTKGILKSEERKITADEPKKETSTSVINVLRSNTTEKISIQNLLTSESAKKFLTDSIQISKLKEPEFLLPLLEPLLTPNLVFDTEKTKEFKQEELDKIATAHGLVKSGDLIIPKGGIITPTVYQKLISFKELYESDYQTSEKFYLILAGYFILTGLLLVLYLLSIRNFAPIVYSKLRWLFFLLGVIIAYTYLTYGIKTSEILNPYALPFCIFPIIVKNFYTRELAFVSHVVNIIVVGLITVPGYEFILLELAGGLMVCFSRFETRYWSQFFKNIFYLVLTYSVCYIGISLIEESNVRSINWSVLVWFSLNGFLTLLAYPLIPLIGNFFGFVSSIALAELSDLNHPLLKELSIKAPGTMQHSLQVAHLSEAAAKAIGADDLLLKVAAMYHDVGKTIQPQYFIENLTDNNNPHNGLAFADSAQIIINHVTEGVKLADKYKLPSVVTDFIKTHHGTTAVEYFYRMSVRDNGSTPTDRKLFQYPGPKPRTKEETILMLADSIEASAKSTPLKTLEAIDDLVERMTLEKDTRQQFTDSEISFAELQKCLSSFKQTLKSMYHSRIEYPKEQI